MKIIILVRILWTAGAQKIAINEARELQLMGNDVELIFLRGKNLKEYDELLKDINYKILSENGNSMFSPLYQYITHRFMPDRGKESRVDYNLIRKFPNYIKNSQVDYLICHDQFAGLAGYYSFKRFRIPYSVFIHEKLSMERDTILKKLWHKFEHSILKNATKVFSITEKIARTVEEVHNVKTIANYPGMDINKITEFEKKENALITVSTWDYGRKPTMYLDIIEEIPHFVLYFAGNFRIANLEKQFKEEVKRRELEDRIIMKQGINESELIELYRKCKFVIRFGFGEYGLGTSSIEAIQNCDPLIINSNLGTADMIIKYSCGVVLEDINSDKVKEFIEANNNKNSYDMLQQNIIKLSKAYSWKNHVEKLLIPLNTNSDMMIPNKQLNFHFPSRNDKTKS